MTSNLSEKKYRVCEPMLGGNELRYVLQAMLANDISGKGSYVRAFEKRFEKEFHVKHAIAVSNGSMALFLACQALNIGRGDEVICPTFTMVATASAPLILGAKCRWVDCRKNGCINADYIEQKITKKTKAILVTHIYGQVCDMDRILEIARRHKLRVIEDAAEAHGAFCKAGVVGTIGDIGCFSFYANKIITCGEGGMVCTNDDTLAEKLRSLREYATIDNFTYSQPALNGRISNLAAAIGLAQLENLNSYVCSRMFIAGMYDKLLSHVDNLTTFERPSGSVCWMYGILVKCRDEFIQKLSDIGIETRRFFVPMHLQPFNGSWDQKPGYPVAEYLSENGLYLPTYSALDSSDILHISSQVKRLAGDLWRNA